ncbi:MAG: hypothetical protein K2I35_10090 [Duncaniella sp.]|nr:hypothetical protein [Duncaniella sp.]
MNNISPLRKALESRGAARRLPADFSSRVMTEIREAERVRRRCDLVWSIVGYVAAAAVAIVTLVYCCGNMFASVVTETVNGFTASTASWTGIMVAVFSSAALLLLLDGYMRRRLLLPDKGKSVPHGNDDSL